MEKESVKVLTVDDDAFLRRLLSRQLINLGYSKLKEVGDALQALQVLQRLRMPPDVIILDLKLPGMDGIEFVRHLAERRYPGQVILVSGEDERLLRSASHLVAAHHISVLGYLLKPFEQLHLGQLMEKLLIQLPSRVSGVARGLPSEAELKTAIQDRQLYCLYQPIVTAAEGELANLEALVRWDHPVHGEVPPEVLVGLAEETGLMHELTRWVVTTALKQLLDWRKEGVHCGLSINLSMADLEHLDFTDWLLEETIGVGVQPWDLTLEVTETRAMRRPELVLDNLVRMRLKGFKLAVDDFGTGHASMAQVRDIPFDQFKLDRSFVQGAAERKENRVMFESSLGMARDLGLEVTAEGVETESDWQFVRGSECHKVQGYFVARPMPGDRIRPWLEEWCSERRRRLIPERQIVAPDSAVPSEGFESSAVDQSEATKGSVLVIEDNGFQRKVQSRILRQAGFKPFLAIDANDALEQLKTFVPDLILVDVELPGINGLELLRRLRRTRKFSRTPALVVSGVNTKAALEGSRSAGANGFIVKPFTRQSLLDSVERALAATSASA